MMMERQYTRAALRNLRDGASKMEDNMTAAARVRREFRLGRPPKPVDDVLPLHPKAAWDMAMTALRRFRLNMAHAMLNPHHVAAAIVWIESADPDKPHMLPIEKKAGENCEECQIKVFETLSRGDVITLGMIFGQFDEENEQISRFPYQFTGLNERGIAVLRNAATMWKQASEILNKVN